MAQINYELDLRSPECRNRSKIFKPKTIMIMLYLLVLALLILCCFMLDSYTSYLQAETELLINELAEKNRAAEPLLAMLRELEIYNLRQDVAEKHFDRLLIKSDHLEAIKNTISPGLSINYLAIDAEGKIDIRGSCSSLHAAALYAKRLNELPFVRKAELKAADLNENSSGFYKISAELVSAAGGD